MSRGCSTKLAARDRAQLVGFNAAVRASEPGGARQEKVTIRQVAQAAGVSIATVSRVVNGHADVSAVTRQAVERVVREHGYQAAARRPGLAPATGLVGVTTPWVLPGYFAEIVSGVSEALYEHGLRTMLCPTRQSHERETSLLERLVSGDADGAVLVLPEESAEELRALAEHGFPFVVVDPRTEVLRRHPRRLRRALRRRHPGDPAPAKPRAPADRRDRRPAGLGRDAGAAARLPRGAGRRRRLAG